MEEDKPRGTDFLVLLLGTVGFLVGTTTGLHLVFKAADRWVRGWKSAR
jgi:autotransporter translocation and assembly factor TamB